MRVKDNKVESDMVLTAAHCIVETICAGDECRDTREYSDVNTLTVLAGNHWLNKIDAAEQSRDVSEMVYYDDYDPLNNNHDVAVVKLTSPVRFTAAVQPIALARQDETVVDDAPCELAGWGYVRGTTEPEELQYINVSVLSKNACQGYWSDVYNHDTMVCVKPRKPVMNMCKGDSGSPLICESKDGKMKGYGVASFVTSISASGDKNDICQFYVRSRPDVFARISNYVDWINEKVNTMSSLA